MPKREKLQSPHVSVLLDEVVENFSGLKGIFLDCTLGYGGHSQAVLEANEDLNLIACDKDVEAIEFSKKRLASFGKRVKIFKSAFSQAIKNLSKDEIKNVRAILADIGVSSLQLDKNERGFGLNSDALDMRMDKSAPLDASEVVNFYAPSELERIFRDYGELANAKAIANKIVLARRAKPIASARELARIIGTASVKGRSVSESVLAFQAIRIEVNNELGELKDLLESIKNAGFHGCKVAIISFHSLEDRIVKNTFKSWAASCICPQGAMRCECGNNHAIGKILTKKAVCPSAAEIRRNSRSSCAKMRVFEIR